MKLTIPEPTIELYKDGFDKHDKLDRKPMAQKLSNLVENVDDPLVIALDGGWGSGKSVFLKCWVGEHLKRHRDKTTTLYFDAFEHDYLDDPLIVLTGALAERLKESGRKPAALKKLKTAAFKIAPMAARLGLAAVTAGGTEIAGALGDAIIHQSAENVEKAAEAYWKREDGRRAAMAQFREALTSLTKPDENGDPQQKLVIVIDELDRCRPDYALQMLEVIKHFFATPGVHFVLGTNMQELANSVRARYGDRVDAERYLHRFVQITMPMPSASENRPSERAAVKHFGVITDALEINSDIWRIFNQYLLTINQAQDLTLRDVERLATLMVITPTQYNENNREYYIFAGLLILQVLKPQWVQQAREGKLTFSQLRTLFHWSEKNPDPWLAEMVQPAWRISLDPAPDEATKSEAENALDKTFVEKTSRTIVTEIITQSLDSFKLPR